MQQELGQGEGFIASQHTHRDRRQFDHGFFQQLKGESHAKHRMGSVVVLYCLWINSRVDCHQDRERHRALR